MEICKLISKYCLNDNGDSLREYVVNQRNQIPSLRNRNGILVNNDIIISGISGYLFDTNARKSILKYEFNKKL